MSHRQSAYGFLTLIQVLDGPDLVDSFFECKGILGSPLPLASNATSAVSDMIVPAIIARITSKYFRIASVFYGLAMPKSTANTNEESSSPVSTMRISSAMPNPVRKVPEGLARKEVPYRGPGSYRGG